MKAFLTGSRRYGTPNIDSDMDICIFCEDNLLGLLWEMSESKNSIRFGKLNVIAFAEEAKYKKWREVTEKLFSIGPVTRDRAIEEFQAAGFTDKCYGKPDKEQFDMLTILDEDMSAAFKVQEWKEEQSK